MFVGFRTGRNKVYIFLAAAAVMSMIVLLRVSVTDAAGNVIHWQDSMIVDTKKELAKFEASRKPKLRYDGSPDLALLNGQLMAELNGLFVPKKGESEGNPLSGTILDNPDHTNPNKAPVPRDYAGEVLTDTYVPYEQYRVVKTTYGNPDKIPKSTMFTIVRNTELPELLGSIQQLESRFNNRFHYDWVFVNDVPFTPEFIEKTSAMVSGTARYGVIPHEHWSYPAYIDQQKARAIRESPEAKKMVYGDSESYRFMCRYNSRYFYHHPIMEEYELYWRVEPSVTFQCDIIEDPFRYLQETGTMYGFTIAFLEFEATIKTLWRTSKDFFTKKEVNEKLIPESDSLLSFVTENNGETYNNCHFWTNFEIANLTIWRSEVYEQYVDYLDRSGGFFYERWGDAPIHSIAVSRMYGPEEIHAFQEISYQHTEATTCPTDDDLWKRAKCTCNPASDWTVSSRLHCNRHFLKVSKQKPLKDFNKYLEMSGNQM